ncbi:MAG: hypothetical protein LBJ04_19990 [Sphingobacterium sp.]|jgi:hypothetical protein|nr:hypothetical protein [Sphingobacterium sp.]
MKKLIFILAMMVTVSLANAQKILEKEIPAAIKSAFQQKYPNVKSVK